MRELVLAWLANKIPVARVQHILGVEQMVQTEGIILDPVEEANPHLLHAEVSVIVARKQFGVQDEEILPKNWV